MSTPDSHGRAPADAAGPPAGAAVEGEIDRLVDPDDDFDDDLLEDEASTGLEIAFTPRQILGGFALLAALILLLRRRKRSE